MGNLLGGGGGAVSTYEVPMSMANQSTPFSAWPGGNPGLLPGQTAGLNAGWSMSPEARQGLAAGLGEFTKGIANQRNESPQALRANNQQYQYKAGGVVGEPPKFPSGNPARIDSAVSGGYTPIERPLPPVVPTGYRAPIEPTRGGGVFRARRYVIT